MIDRLLQPLLSLHGWEAYLFVGLLVFAEAAIMLGFVFPGETAAILGGVLASKGGVNLTAIVAVVVVCAIVGDSVGYAVGDNWGPQLLRLGPLRKRQKGINAALDQLNRRGPAAVFVARFSAFLRAVVPGLAGLSSMRYRTFLWSNAAGGLCWGVLYTLLGYFVGQRVEKATGIASDVVLGLILVVIVVLIVRHHRRDKECRGTTPLADQEDGRPNTPLSPARSPATTRANSPAASSPTASVSMKWTALGSLRSTPKMP
jgi:membrane-associated protein